MIRYKSPDGKWRRSPAARGKNGRVRSGYAQVGQEQIAVTSSYTYDLRTHEGRVTKYIPAGAHAADAEAERQRLEKVAAAKAIVEDAGLRIEADPERRTLRNAMTSYLDDARARGALEALEQARLVAEEFQAVCTSGYVDEITREDIVRFHAALRKRGCSPRTVANKHARLKSILLFAGAEKGIIPPAPRYDQKLPTIYTAAQIDAILAADEHMRLAINVALKCGLREQELMHLEWKDIDWHEGVLRVRSKPAYGFGVKDAEERDIPIPDDLMTILKSAKEASDAPLVLGGKKPRRHLLRELKELARRAELNCGVCRGCNSHLQQCQEWTLHKFRRTYCTSLLRSGMDLRTVQAFMGHADMASTMRYLRPASSKEVREKVNKVVFG